MIDDEVFVGTAAPFFEKATRTEGGHYFDEMRIFDLAISDSDGQPTFECAVEGSEQFYSVKIPASIELLDKLGSCECRHFELGHKCKHMWAAILAIEESTQSVLSGGKFVSRPMSLSKSVEGKKNGIAPWMEFVEATRSFSGVLKSDAATTWGNQFRLYYVIELERFSQLQNMEVSLFVESKKPDGNWSGFEKFSFDPLDRPKGFTSVDSEIMEWIAGSALPDMDFGLTYRNQVGSFVLSEYQLDVLTKKLCESQRFGWTQSAPGSPHEIHFLTDSQIGACHGNVEFSRVNDDTPNSSGDRSDSLDVQLVCDDREVDKAKILHVAKNGLILAPDCIYFLANLAIIPWLKSNLDHGVIEIPENSRLRFLQSVSAIADTSILELPEDWNITHQSSAPLGKLSISSNPLASNRKDFIAEISFDYDGIDFTSHDVEEGLFDAAESLWTSRNRAAEQMLVQFFLENGGGCHWKLVDQPFFVAPQKIYEVVANCIDAGWIVMWEDRRCRSFGNFEISVNAKQDWFELEGAAQFGDLNIELPELLAAARQQNRQIVLSDGSIGLISDKWMEQISRLANLAEGNEELRFRSSQALLLEAMLAGQSNVEYDQKFLKLRDQLKEFNGIQPREAPETFQGQLRNYQKEGVGWLHFLREFQFGGCLADDMGLGKTIQVLALLEDRRKRSLTPEQNPKPSIVVVPKSLVFNWIDEASRFTPELRFLNYTGLRRKKLLERGLAENSFDVLITTYGTCRNDILELQHLEFDYCILDESQAIKNESSLASKACRLLKGDHRLAMTGTPIENHLGELWSLFDFLNPGMIGKGLLATSANSKTSTERLGMLSAGLRPFILRRTKEQVLPDLPQKTEQTLYCEMTPSQKKEYKKIREYYRSSLAKKVDSDGVNKSKIYVLEALMRLRQVACDPRLLDQKTQKPGAKVELLIEQVSSIIDGQENNKHKALIFSQFTSLLSLVRKEVEKRQWDYEYLDGKTTDRASCVNRFQEDPNCQLFLISLKAGGHGLNLTAADYVYILDPWWNPAAEAQAIDRAHRMGQTKPVMAYRLIAKETVEEKIVALQQDKKELADSIINADQSLIQSLTAEDIELLLS